MNSDDRILALCIAGLVLLWAAMMVHKQGQYGLYERKVERCAQLGGVLVDTPRSYVCVPRDLLLSIEDVR